MNLALGPRMVVVGTQKLVLQPPARIEAVLARAVELGVDWLDTADVYGAAPGDGERLLAGVARRVRVCTKGGLVRRGARWLPDGRARHLLEAAEASRARLRVEAIDLYLLHVPDPRVPLRTSLGALARLQQDGVARAVGLCNVTLGQLRQATDHIEVAAVQVPLGLTDPSSIRSGVIETCLARGIPILGYRPLGEAKGLRRLRGHPRVQQAAHERGVAAAELVLAWISDLGVTPLPGPTRPETLESCARAPSITLTDDERGILDALRPETAQLRRPRRDRAPPPHAEGEVRIVMGSPGAGKSSIVSRWTASGFRRLNRDARGGTLANVTRALGKELQAGHTRIVLDNTYPSRASRNTVIEEAWAAGVPAHLTWVDTPPGDCEWNLVKRVLDAMADAGEARLPHPAELKQLPRRDPRVVPPQALLRYRSQLEAPEEEEGFASLERLPFTRDEPPGAPCVVVDPRDLEPFAEVLAERAAAGAEVLLAGWAPGVDAADEAERWRTRAAAVGVPVHPGACPHPAGPPVCWCRKPWLGLPVWLARRAGADLTRAIVVATTPADRTMAHKLGAPVAETPAELRQLGDVPRGLG